MSARTPIVLFVVAAILLAYVLLFERDRPGRSEIDSRSGLLLEACAMKTSSAIANSYNDNLLIRAGDYSKVTFYELLSNSYSKFN